MAICRSILPCTDNQWRSLSRLIEWCWRCTAWQTIGAKMCALIHSSTEIKSNSTYCTVTILWYFYIKVTLKKTQNPAYKSVFNIDYCKCSKQWRYIYSFTVVIKPYLPLVDVTSWPLSSSHDNTTSSAAVTPSSTSSEQVITNEPPTGFVKVSPGGRILNWVSTECSWYALQMTDSDASQFHITVHQSTGIVSKILSFIYDDWAAWLKKDLKQFFKPITKAAATNSSLLWVNEWHMYDFINRMAPERFH